MREAGARRERETVHILSRLAHFTCNFLGPSKGYTRVYVRVQTHVHECEDPPPHLIPFPPFPKIWCDERQA